MRWNKTTRADRAMRSRNSPDLMRRIIVPVEGQGEVTLSKVCLHCHRYPLEDDIWWVSSVQLIVCCMWWPEELEGPRILVIQDSTDNREVKVFRAHAAPHGACDNLINALRHLANKQKNGDSPVNVLVQKSEFTRFITVDYHEAVKVGDLEKNMESARNG